MQPKKTKICAFKCLQLTEKCKDFGNKIQRFQKTIQKIMHNMRIGAFKNNFLI